jgi:hypothetical protein
VALLHEWIAPAIDRPADAEFYGDRAVFTALRGGDPSSDLERGTELRETITDPQYEAYDNLFRAWDAFAAGRFADAHELAAKTTTLIRFFYPLATPIAGRAALWAGDLAKAEEWLHSTNSTIYRGEALARDMDALDAGIAALSGRRAEALAKYRDALAGYRSLGLAFDEALTTLDVVKFVGSDDREIQGAVEVARQTFTRLGAKPLLERLEATLADRPGVATSLSEVPAAAGVA